LTTYCYRHPETETALRCGNCGRPICVKCIVQHPVGVRCPECARPTKIPGFDVTSVYYVRAVAAAAVIGVLGVLALLLLGSLLGPLGLLGYYLRWLALVGVGYIMGVAVNFAVARKRGLGLQWVAALGVLGVFAVLLFLLPGVFALSSLVAILALAAAVYLAVMQLRI